MARILIGVSGGIAAYKSVELARAAIKAGHTVRVLATANVERFVGHATFEGITGAKVLVGEFDDDPLRGSFPGEEPPSHLPIGHLELAERADAFIVAPATANTVAKLASGIADSALTTAFLACTAPRIVAPAMNDRMYLNPATQENLARLRGRGVTVLEPGTGDLASKGEYGIGRLPEPNELLAAIEAELGEGGAATASRAPAGDDAWRDLRVLISAGGTREPLDGVRFLGNRSSGRMGVALAEAALARGARVTLVAANLAVAAPVGVDLVEVETTAELAAACRDHFGSSDVLIMAAAPADFRPREVADGKIRRETALTLELEPTEDILAGLAAEAAAEQTLVGFAADIGETGRERAAEKLTRKAVDLIVYNDVSDSSIGFDSHENAVTLISATNQEPLARANKREIADAILDRVERLRQTEE
jgi:phosphopantothenoylcysteine decarboxylase/phosphopantothenate--cysteine ligase